MSLIDIGIVLSFGFSIYSMCLYTSICGDTQSIAVLYGGKSKSVFDPFELTSYAESLSCLFSASLRSFRSRSLFRSFYLRRSLCPADVDAFRQVLWIKVFAF